MLILKDIKKDYGTSDNIVKALKGVSLSFRENEFVSILGQSGCGKTTLLNIIGGLDKYTSGDLVIDGVSTKEYKDKDWDYYRNSTIGFVFQSYNLIPHLNVLENVDTEYWFEIEKYYYENHQIMSEKYLIENNEIKTKIAQIYNKDMLDGLKNRNEDDYAWFNMFDNSISRHAYFNDEDFDKIKNLILNDDNEIDFNKRYVVISFNSGSSRKEHFYVTDNEELYRIYLDKVNKDYRDEYYYKDPEVIFEYVEEIDNTVVNEIN
jgi:ABC-type Fe3+/spermidine/putrescine transport system ATPase subunit